MSEVNGREYLRALGVGASGLVLEQAGTQAGAAPLAIHPIAAQTVWYTASSFSRCTSGE